MVRKKTYPVLWALFAVVLFSAIVATVFFVPSSAVYAAEEGHTEYALQFKKYTVSDYTADTVVTDPIGSTVQTDENGTFTPLRVGDYRVRAARRNDTVRVFASVPVSQYLFEFALGNDFATGEIISLPQAAVSSEIEKNADYTLFIRKDDEIIKTIRRNEEHLFQPEQAGNYSAVYAYVDCFGYISDKILDFAVQDRAVVAVPPIQPLAYKGVVRLSEVYAYKGGEKTAATLKVTDPDSLTVNIAGNTFVADKLGNYTFEYTASVGGENVSKTEVVPCGLYTRDMFEPTRMARDPVSGVELPDNYVKSADGNNNGVLLAANVSGAVFTYNNVINLNSIDRDTNILTLAPYVTGEYSSAETIEVVLTDVYDSYNSIKIQYKRSPWHDALTYVTGAYNGRHYAKNNEQNDGTVKIGDTYFFGGLMRNYYSMIGKGENLRQYSFGMDYADRMMLLDLTAAGEGRFELVDLDNPDWVGGEQYTWHGFTTGEAILSICFGTLEGNSAAVLVTEVMGQSLAGDELHDDAAPAMVVDMPDEYLANMPFGAVGKPYSLPRAWAHDAVNGETEVTRILTRTDGNTAVAVSGDVFVPTEAGSYGITYVAEDVSGNRKTEFFDFEVYAEAPEITAELAEYATPAIGSHFKIPEIIVTGASGLYDLTRTVRYNGIVTEPDAADKIYLNKAGEITVTIAIEDFIGNSATETFTLSVSADLPRVFIPAKPTIAQAGRTLKFAEAVLTDFDAAETSKIDKKITINGEELSDGEYKVKQNDSVLNVVYTVKVNGRTVTEEFAVPVAEADDASKRFAGDGTYMKGGDAGNEVHFEFLSDGKVSLVNAVAHNQLRIETAVPVKNFESLDIVFTDSVNPDVSVFVRVTSQSGKRTGLQLNGAGDVYMINEDFSAGASVTFFYDSEREIFKTAVSEKRIFAVTRTSGGDVFDGFPSKGVKVEFVLSGVSARSVLHIGAVSNENFGNYVRTGRDINAPQIALDTETGNVRGEFGKTYRIEPTYGYDVLQGIFEASVTVTDPDGNVLLDGEVLKKDYLLELTSYGEYIVYYETLPSAYTTAAGRAEVYVTVKDEQAPEITLNGELPQSVKLGDRITLPTVSVTDNVTKNPVIRIWVYDPDYKNTAIQAGTGLRFTKRGTYKIVYTATDEAGNIKRVQYRVEVKA